MRLHISGGAHFGTATQQRLSDISKHVEDIDILFIEDRNETEVSRKNRLFNWFTALFVLLFIHGWIRFLGILNGAYSDSEIQRRIVEEYDPEVVPVDAAVHELLSQGRFNWFVYHWGAVALPIGFVWVVAQYDLQLASALLQIPLFYGIVVVAGFLAGTMSGRDNRMLINVLRSTTDSNIEEAVLLVGGSHASNLAETAERLPGLDVNLLHARTLRDNLQLFVLGLLRSKSA